MDSINFGINSINSDKFSGMLSNNNNYKVSSINNSSSFNCDNFENFQMEVRNSIIQMEKL